MNLSRHILLPITFLCLAGIRLHAQNDADLLRYSMLNPVGTARYNAMGGAFGALGANFSILSSNPAGIGLYTRHEISFTGGLLTTNARSDYYGQSSHMDNTLANVPQGGGIFEIYRNPGKGNGLKRLQLGFGANRIKDFNSNWYTQGNNPQSSYMQYVETTSRGYDFSSDYGQGLGHVGNLAYQTGLMDFVDSNSLDYITFLGPGLDQRHILKESGNISEMTFSFGGNWADMIYFGATLGLPIVDYNQESLIGESVPYNGPELPHSFNSYTIKQDLYTNGTGINLKLGVIYKPLHFFRIGLAFHTPTYYWLKESSSVSMTTDMRYEYEGSVLPNFASYRYDDNYNIVTPAKGILSLGFLIKNFGSIAIEGELTDYRTMRFEKMNDIDYQNQMRDLVRENYQMAGVVRAGTEWKVSILSVRAGYIWQSCPYKNPDLKKQWSDHTATAGLGLSLGSWNLDFAFMANLGKRTDDFYYLVDQKGTPLVQPAQIRFAKYVYTLGLSYRF